MEQAQHMTAHMATLHATQQTRQRASSPRTISSRGKPHVRQRAILIIHD